MSTAPAFASTPHIERGRISAANTNRDGTGTIADIFTATSSGSKAERLVFQGTGTTTAGMIRIYTHDGTNWRLFDEIAVQAIVPSATVKAWRAEYDCSRLDALLQVKTGWKLGAAPHNAETFDVTVIGGDY